MPLVAGHLVRRYNRFLVDVVLDGSPEIVTGHCPNSGSMLGVCEPGSRVWLSPAASPGRKLGYTLELVEAEGGLVGVNTQRPNALVAEAIGAGRIPALTGYRSLRREVRYGVKSRVDLVLDGGAGPPCYVEIKNVHLRRPDRGNGRAAEFPDCVTARGTKHVRELTAMVAAGFRAVLLFLVQRADCDHVRTADDLDPIYGAALRAGVAAGVETIAHACIIAPGGITVGPALPVRLDAEGRLAA